MFKILKILDRTICEIEKFLVAFGIIALSVAVFSSVFTRSLFNWAWIGTEELSQFLVISITFWGTSWAVRENRHIAMTALLELAPEKAQKALMIMISLITAIFCFVISYIGWDYTKLAYKGGQISAALQLPVWPVYLAVPIGMLLSGIQFMKEFFKLLKRSK
jgi:TRAP-type C4-dicarboxylate transport system permease small subunit